MTEYKLFGLTFREFDQSDWSSFAGAEEGSMISSDGKNAYILGPEKDCISIINSDGEEIEFTRKYF